MKKVIALVGPTASGKSAAAVRLAREIGGEIISCDSMQIYRRMNIGTAKITEDEKQGIPHYMIDVADPGNGFSCADFKAMATKTADEIISRGKMPILCGGTGLYLDSFLLPGGFSPDIDGEIRTELEKKTSEELWAELVSVDPASAEKTHINNKRRVVRALEIYYGTGITKSEWDRRSLEKEPEYSAEVVILNYRDRNILYDRINKRVDVMLENGLVSECRELDLDRGCNAAQAIGYKEIYSYLDGGISYGEAVELLKKNSRNYAKRQLTWFGRYKNASVLYRDECSDDEIFEKIVNLVKKSNNNR